jgi:hypothetical protein
MKQVFIVVLCCLPAGFASAETQDRPPAELKVQALPSTIDIEGAPSVVRNVKGFVATITNVGNAAFLVPDARKFNTACSRIRARNSYCTSHAGECSSVSNDSCLVNSGITFSPKSCSDLDLKDKAGNTLDVPLYTLGEWSQIVQPVPPYVMVNANWFNVGGPPSTNFPHTSPCTQIYGYSVNAGVEVSPYHRPDSTQGEKLDALVITPGMSARYGYDLSILSASGIEGALRSRKLPPVRYAIGGFLIAEEGKVRAVDAIAKAAKPAASGARSAVGLSADGHTMHIVVFQNKLSSGITAKELALYMVKVLKDRVVLNLDNSGSSQLLYQDGHTTTKTIEGDNGPMNQPAYRPIPTFLALSTAGVQGCAYAGMDRSCAVPLFRDTSDTEKPDLKKRGQQDALNSFEAQGNYYSNAPYLLDDARWPYKVPLESCAQRCLDHPLCRYFTYAYSRSSKYCTLYGEGTKMIATRSDYKLFKKK